MTETFNFIHKGGGSEEISSELSISLHVLSARLANKPKVSQVCGLPKESSFAFQRNLQLCIYHLFNDYFEIIVKNYETKSPSKLP